MAQFHLAKGMAHYCAGRYETAAEIGRGVIQRHPDLPPGYVHFARSAAMMGHLDEARRAMARAVELNPNLRVSRNAVVPIMRRPQDADRLREGSRLAGMPE